ncbi:SRPBCC family protein [Pedococcus bigeumensis]|uniref:SRPBCC family protein n=1 Tax=Pedococcus bigeumensis TaxID=433644 RepID=UPI002FE7373E
MWWSRRPVGAPAESVWGLLVDLDAWPRWGPTVTAARLDDGGRVLTRGARGAVRTPAGLWVPFEVTELVETPELRQWSWSVAGVPATTHRVGATARVEGRGCVVELGAPWWAPAYLPVLELGTRRLAALAEGGRG